VGRVGDWVIAKLVIGKFEIRRKIECCLGDYNYSIKTISQFSILQWLS
jgi:hypothetical protein